MSSSPLSAALEHAARGQSLTRAEARAVLEHVFAPDDDPQRPRRRGEADRPAPPQQGGDHREARGVAPQKVAVPPARDMQIAALLMAITARGETVEEVVGFAEAMRAAVAPIGLKAPLDCVDTCGTGGLARQVFNISTAAAFVAAGAGATVAKHGNRSQRSVSGSADVLAALGVNLDFPAARLGECLRACGIAFFYAPLLHAAMRSVMPARNALPFRTIFNLLGPLTNPAHAASQVIGVTDAAVLPLIAEALVALGTHHSFVVASDDGLGEFSTAAGNQVAEIRDGQIRRFSLDARDLGLRRTDSRELHCPDAATAVVQMRSLLEGESSPRADIVCLNAAAALVASGIAPDFAAGLERARHSLASGAARVKLELLIAATQTAAAAASRIG